MVTQQVSVVAAFSAGFLSFFAPCILPLIPPYFAWLLGVSRDEAQKKNIKLKVFLHSIILVFGFAVVFIILGASASKIGRILAPHRLLMQRIGGVVIILFGLEFAGFSKILKNRQISIVRKLFSRIGFVQKQAVSGLSRKIGSLLVGLVFAVAWVACFSPILGSILVLSAFQGTLTQGIVLLTFYSLGLAVPFLIVSLFLGFAVENLKIFTKIAKWINLFSGLILMMLGILLLTDDFYRLVMWITKAL